MPHGSQSLSYLALSLERVGLSEVLHHRYAFMHRSEAAFYPPFHRTVSGLSHRISMIKTIDINISTRVLLYAHYYCPTLGPDRTSAGALHNLWRRRFLSANRVEHPSRVRTTMYS